jgi:hypothetical protein
VTVGAELRLWIVLHEQGLPVASGLKPTCAGPPASAAATTRTHQQRTPPTRPGAVPLRPTSPWETAHSHPISLDVTNHYWCCDRIRSPGWGSVTPGAELLSEAACTLHSFDDRTIMNTATRARVGRPGVGARGFDE